MTHTHTHTHCETELYKSTNKKGACNLILPKYNCYFRDLARYWEVLWRCFQWFTERVQAVNHPVFRFEGCCSLATVIHQTGPLSPRENRRKVWCVQTEWHRWWDWGKWSWLSQGFVNPSYRCGHRQFLYCRMYRLLATHLQPVDDTILSLPLVRICLCLTLCIPWWCHYRQRQSTSRPGTLVLFIHVTSMELASQLWQDGYYFMKGDRETIQI